MIDKIILNYKIEKQLGAGGMGCVYLASNLNIEQKVAIKVLNAELSQSTIVRQKFKDEAKMLCSLDHPNIVKFLNFVENEEGIFLVMEYVDGVTLENFIMEKNGLIVEERVYELFDQVLSGVAYAHKRGIVHRDIKPSNIILTPDAEGEMQVKILDFGIAKLVSGEDESENGWVVGTPSYMSPEQVNGGVIDQRSDVYSLGVLLHQMLTGKTPYDTTTLSEVKIKDMVMNAPLPRMKEYYGYVSEKMQRIVDKAVEKDPKKRFQSCSEFRNAMKKALRPDRLPVKTKYAVAALLVVLIGLGGWYWDYQRVKVEYFKDYAEKWGEPQGIGKLSGSEAEHSNRHYRFEYSKYKLQRMSHVNSLDKIISDGESERYERPLDMLLFYGDNGKIAYAKILDHNGKVLYKKSYNDKLNTVVFQYDDEYNTEKTLSARTVGYVKSFDEGAEGKGKISRWLLEYDDKGFVTKVQYAGFQNVLVGDAHGIFGRKYVVDDKGRVVEERYLGRDGMSKATKWGLGIKRFHYDASDNWTQADYLTVDGAPSYDDADGVGIYKMEYDRYGNVLLAMHCESDGKPMLPKKSNVAGVSYVYDDQGFITLCMYLGLDRKPCFVPGEGVAGYKAECDKNGFFNRQTYVDADGNVCLSSKGMAVNVMVNDERGNTVECWTYDEGDRLVETSDGYAGYKARLDSLGNCAEYVTYGADRQPCLQSDGTAGYRAEYNELSKIVKMTNLGTDLLPCKSGNGVSVWVCEYDKRGNQVMLSYYDRGTGKLALSDEGTAGWNSVYDENGNETERAFFGIDRKPCLITSGYAKWRSKFDEQGNELETVYYGLDDRPVYRKDGSVGRKYKYDERGNVVENFPMDEDGKLAAGKLILRHKYDKFDNDIECAVFDRDNTPALNGQNWHRMTTIYNERNQEVEVRYFDRDNQPTMFEGDEYSIERYIYDGRGNRIETMYFGTDGKPCLCSQGWAYSTYEYDAMNRVVKQSFFDTDKEPTRPEVMVPEGFVKYDKWGNRIYLAAGDGQGHLIFYPQKGWAIREAEYDIRGNELKRAYFGPDHTPCVSKDEACWKMESAYDKKGNNIEERYYGVDGKLRAMPFAYYRRKYDTDGNRVEEAWFDRNGRPCNNTSGYQKVAYEYKDRKATFCTVYYDNDVTEKYRRVDGKWVSMDRRETPAVSDWRAMLEKEQKNCPQMLGDGVSIQSIELTSNSCTITVKLLELSKYNISSEDLEVKKSQVNELLRTYRKTFNMPEHAILTIQLTDKADRVICEASLPDVSGYI